MSKAEFLVIIGTFIGAFVTLLSAIENNIIKIFLKEDATSAPKAIEIPAEKLFSRWRINRFKRTAVLVEGAPDLYYFLASRYKIILKKRVRTVIILFAIILTLTLIFFN